MTTIIATIVLLSIIQVVVSNSLSTTGVELAKMQKQKDAYVRTNVILQEKLLSASSFTYISSRAGEMGFVEDKEKVFVKESLPLASSHDR